MSKIKYNYLTNKTDYRYIDYWFIRKMLERTTPYEPVSGEGTNFTIDSPSNRKFNNISLKGNTFQDGTPTPETPISVQVVTGEQTVKVNNNNYNISLGGIELCKLGEYQDYIFKSGDKWYKYKAIGKYKFTSSETGSYQSSFPRFSINFSHGQDSTTAIATQALCTHLKVGQTGNTNNTFGISTNVIYIRNESCTSLAELNQWFGNGNVSVYFILANSVEEEITDSDLIDQLNNLLSNGRLIKGVNTIVVTSSNDNLPAIIRIEA